MQNMQYQYINIDYLQFGFVDKQQYQEIRKTNKFIHNFISSLEMDLQQIENQNISKSATKLSEIPQHTRMQFVDSNPNSKQPIVFFDSNFDSGNMSRVIKNSYDHYSIWTASDAEGSQYVGYPKSWFYFRVGGFKKRKVSFSIFRVHFLWAMVNRKNLYRPVYRILKNKNNSQSQTQIAQINKYQQNNKQQVVLTSQKQQYWSQWKRLPHPVQSLQINSEQQLVLKFDFFFDDDVDMVQFAFTYPYSHEQCHNDVMKMQQKYEDSSEIFFKSYQLCRSYQGRCIDMILISSHQGKQGHENIKTDATFTLGDKKLVKFRNNKPIIFISARVHPIQTPSSFTMTGILQFLLNSEDYRAHLLRKYFVFVIVPMLNPDGVSNGHCRMDCLNQNLNRYYNNPDPIKHPSCYSIIKLCEHFNKDERLFMYLDLHAHPANKGNFIFGNAIFDYIEQVQSHLFPKVLSQNCINFQFQQCNFSRKHMKAKDRNEDLNKEGCGRVVFYKQFGLTHSYTLQCGYHCNTYNNQLNSQINQNKIYIARYKKNQKSEYIYDNFQQSIVYQSEEQIQKYLNKMNQRKNSNANFTYKSFNCSKNYLDNIENQHYKKQTVFFEQQTFYNLGRNISISILDIWNKNPYTRIQNINEQRKQIAEKQAKLDRFRKQQVGIKTKQKKIVELIQTQFYGQWHKKNVFQVQISSTNFSKNQIKLSQNIKKTDKSLTITQAREQISSTSSIGKMMISKYANRNKTIANKQQKKIGVIQPSLQSIKLISGSDIVKGPMLLKPVLDAKSFFKPFNVRVRNLNLGNK